MFLLKCGVDRRTPSNFFAEIKRGGRPEKRLNKIRCGVDNKGYKIDNVQ
jgi:hypothetical protein